LGDLVIEAEHLKKAFGDRLLIEDLSFSLPPGGIVGVIGPNGAGKSTLFKMLTNNEQPDGGSIRVGRRATLNYGTSGITGCSTPDTHCSDRLTS
jgi:sulfate-transporting ATPase